MHSLISLSISSWTSAALLLLNIFSVQLVSAFPDGAPGETCTDHRPKHRANAQPHDTLPFLIQASESRFKSGDTVAGLYTYIHNSHILQPLFLYSCSWQDRISYARSQSSSEFCHASKLFFFPIILIHSSRQAAFISSKYEQELT
jgi:hypothetical protein